MRSDATSAGNGKVGRAQSPSPFSRILSGSAGSVVYVLTFAPLEVVKIRQQAFGSRAAAAASASFNSSDPFLRSCGAPIPGNGRAPPGDAYPRLVAPRPRHSPAGVCQGLFKLTSRRSHTLAHRTDTPGGIFRTLLSISRNEGRGGLYAGLRPTLLAVVPNTAIYFTAYDEISLRIRQFHAENGSVDGLPSRQVFTPLLAGATARLMSSVATAPLELIRTRHAGAIGNGNGVLEELRLLTRTDGPLALYRGLGPMIMRDVPFSALYFLGLETFKDMLSNSSALGAWGAAHYRGREKRPPASVEVTQTFLSGAAAGTVAVLATTPFDVIKTRRQTMQRAAGNVLSSQGTYEHMKLVVQEEGLFAGLWKGNQARLIKVAP